MLWRLQTAPHRRVQRAEALLRAAAGVVNTRITAGRGGRVDGAGLAGRFAQDGLAKLGEVREGRAVSRRTRRVKFHDFLHLTQHSKPDGQTQLVVPHDGHEGRAITGLWRSASGPHEA
jgi:hypothetical protein